ncbi:MAG: ATP-binding cassette domain-containing protein [Candidatus Omnitrophica bacterium]|nr:ATP-binding cassette domain-containing protein [Candidatus Omnitrophota bacterium]MCB9784822.1 ATP-binding cassette domain-containing protein [Candidatus Omnitrophota bacterium]
MIEVQNLTKNYGPVAAIKNVSFEVGKGEILGFLGPNGAGKTTTMRILTGYFPATSGSAKVAGYDVFNQINEVRKRIGYLPENVPLYTDMSVKGYLNLAAQMKGLSGSAKKKAVDRVIEEVGLIQMRSRLIKKLSKGYRQRVGLAQSLVNNPEVLILDEPTVGLDPKQITDIRSLIKHLAGDRTVILSTHILPEVSMTCDKVTIINRGQIVVSDTLENLTKRSTDFSEISVLVRDHGKDVGSVLRGLPGVKEVKSVETGKDNGTRKFDVSLPQDEDLRGAVAKAITGADIELLEMASRQVTLEEIFIRHITKEEDHSPEPEANETATANSTEEEEASE